MLVRFDIRPDHSGSMGGFVREGLGREDADELADLLNTLDLLRRGRAVH